MPPLAVVASLVGFVSAAWTGPLCFPPICTLDENCNDPIHSNLILGAKCCSGRCMSLPLPSGLLVNAACTPGIAVQAHEVCSGSCDPQISICGDTAKCEGYVAAGCACTLGTECRTGLCLFSNAADNHTACRALPGTQDHDLPCAVDSECKSLNCSSGLCAGRVNAQSCTAHQQCAEGLICRNSACLPSCATGVGGCCTQDSDCATGNGNPNLGWDNYTTYCDRPTGTCTSLPDVGAPCSAGLCLPGHECAAACNGPPGNKCSGAPICQAWGSIPAGGICPTVKLCPSNALACVPVLATSNNSYCVAPGWASLGELCAQYPTECAAPANLCADLSYNNTYTCTVAGSVPVWGKCGQALGAECPPGAPCSSNDTVMLPSTTTFFCNLPLPPGASCATGVGQTECVSSHACFDVTDPSASCALPNNCICTPLPTQGQYCGGIQRCAPNSNLTCMVLAGNWTCVGPTIPDGQDCVSSSQCQGPNSVCNSTTKKCLPILGAACQTTDDCLGGDPRLIWDCSCTTHKCYILGVVTNAPTPAPTAFYINRCQVYTDAWLAAMPFRFPQFTPLDVWNSQSWDTKAPTWMSLSNDTLPKLVDYVCCTVCGSTKPFETVAIQADCRQRTLSRLTQDQCNKKLSRLALLNCWATVSPAKAPVTPSGVNPLVWKNLKIALVFFYCLTLVPLFFWGFLSYRSERQCGFMSMFSVFIGMYLLCRIVFFSMAFPKPSVYVTIFRMTDGNSLLMFLDLLPEVLKLMAWLTLLSFWTSLLADNMDVTRNTAPSCQNRGWQICFASTTILWILTLSLVWGCQGNDLDYTTVTRWEGYLYFTVSLILMIVGLVVITRFVVTYYKNTKKLQQGNRNVGTPVTVTQVLRLRVSYATSLSALSMIFYFVVLFSASQERTPDTGDGFLGLWHSLYLLDIFLINWILWLLAPSSKEFKEKTKRLFRHWRRKREIKQGGEGVRGSSSVGGGSVIASSASSGQSSGESTRATEAAPEDAAL